MKFWLVVNVRICERLHCNHWKYILKDTQEYFSIAPRWLHFRESNWGCIRVSWSKAQRWRLVQGKPSPRCKISRGGDHYIVKPLTTMFSEQCGQKRLFNEQCLLFSIVRCILSVKKDQSVVLVVFTVQNATCAELCTSLFKVYFRCPLCQSLLSIMWNSTLMKMSKLGGHLGEQKRPMSMSSTSRKLDYLTFPP